MMHGQKNIKLHNDCVYRFSLWRICTAVGKN